jgi:hypothetical protein
VREEASRGSTALAAARSELAEEVRLRTHQQQLLIDLKAELQRAQEQLADMHAPGPLLLVEEDASMRSARADTLSSHTRGADAPARDEGAPAKRPREGDSAAEVDARRSFVALYAPSVVGTEWTELVLPGGSSVVSLICPRQQFKEEHCLPRFETWLTTNPTTNYTTHLSATQLQVRV